MPLIQTYITVRPDASLEKAIATEDAGTTDDKDLTESFLDSMSVDYRPGKQSNRKVVVEDPSNEGQDFIADDLHKNRKLPQNP